MAPQDNFPTSSPTTSSPTTFSSTTTPTPVIATVNTTPSSTALTTSQSMSVATASQTVPPNLANPSSSSLSKGISPGAIAGITVAAAVGGALFAFLLTFVLMRSRSRKLSKRFRHVEKRGNIKGTDITITELSEGVSPANYRWEKHLPQSADDNSIRLKVKTLLHQIELHVETFYTTPTSPIKITQDLQLQLLKVDSPHLPQPIVSMLPQVQDQTLLIKHCLAHMIVSKITDEGVNTESFLPPDFTSLPHAMHMARRNTRKPAFNQALSHWRVLTSYLRPDTADDYSYRGCRDANIQTAADTFCTSFGLWANTRYDTAARHQHLTDIMKAAAETGIVVFSQLSTFAYLWAVPTSARQSGVQFVVTPGFAKIADDQAQVLEKPYIMVPHVVHGF